MRVGQRKKSSSVNFTPKTLHRAISFYLPAENLSAKSFREAPCRKNVAGTPQLGVVRSYLSHNTPLIHQRGSLCLVQGRSASLKHNKTSSVLFCGRCWVEPRTGEGEIENEQRKPQEEDKERDGENDSKTIGSQGGGKE